MTTEGTHDRSDAVLAAFDAATLHRAVATLPPADVAALARLLGVPRRLLQEDAAAARVVRRRARGLAPATRSEVALMIAAACNDDTVAALGPRHENPTVEDMAEVLDPIVERHGAHAVALMLAAYVDAAAPCSEVFAHLLDDDERFAIEALDLSTVEGSEVASAQGDAEPAEPASEAAAGIDAEKGARRSGRKERERVERARRAQRAAAADIARSRQKQARRRSPGR